MHTLKHTFQKQKIQQNREHRQNTFNEIAIKIMYQSVQQLVFSSLGLDVC